MNVESFLELARGGRLRLLLTATRQLVNPVYRATFLAAASGHGLLRLLAEGPKSLGEIAAHLGNFHGRTVPLESWLALGVRLRELEHKGGRYALKGWFAKRFARPENDAMVAALEEVVRFHHGVLLTAPTLGDSGGLLSLADQDGALIARSTRIIEPFVREAIDGVLPRDRPIKLLEVGCGSGIYVRHAASRNRHLRAVGLELQEEVAAVAKENLRAWGLSERAEVRHGDLMSVELPAEFDVATLHNNIYYFEPERRSEVLAQVRRFLKPGGRLLITSACRGGNLGLEVLNLWFASSDCGGELPEKAELLEQMRRAGFRQPTARSLIPGDRFYAFSGQSFAA